MNRRKERRFGKIHLQLVLEWRGIGPSFFLEQIAQTRDIYISVGWDL